MILSPTEGKNGLMNKIMRDQKRRESVLLMAVEKPLKFYTVSAKVKINIVFWIKLKYLFGLALF